MFDGRGVPAFRSMQRNDILLQSRLHHGRGLIAAGRFMEARVLYRQICAEGKADADSWFTLGVINGMLGRHDEAAACCARAVKLSPRHAGAWYNLGIAHRDSGKLDAAVTALRKALTLDPENTRAATSLGHALVSLHRYDEAEEVFREILRSQPDDAEFYAVYGSAMHSMGRYEAAIGAYRKAIDLRYPQIAEVHENMAVALCLQGRYQESLAHYAAAFEHEPNNARIYSSMLLTLHYLPEVDAGDLLDRHRHWPGNAVCQVRVPGSSPRGGRLRVGYLSSDLRKHSVAFFIEPLLTHHNAARYEIVCYFSHRDADAVTERLRGKAHRWRDVSDMDDIQLAQTISADGIDILVDLNGHTAGNRLPVFARRVAPVQVSFIGYPGTTGVVNMDYRLVDAITDPPGTEHLCTETLVRLPSCFLCYRPPDESPAVEQPPCENNGYVTFGSFNNLAKINSDVIALWAQLLQEIPDSRLILKNPSLRDRAVRERFQTLFAEVGVDRHRIDLMGYIPEDTAHLGVYGRVDIALDTFPYNGTTTTCEALWMGVPVICLRGDRHSGRVGMSLLTAAGFPDWIANTPEQYIRIARNLARDRKNLGVLRLRLRECMRQSRLCSAEDYTRAVEKIYEELYAHRCQAS